MTAVGIPPKNREKESHIPDSKNASSKDNLEVKFEFLTYLEHDLSNNQNVLNTLDDKKADLSADKGVDKIQENDKSNKQNIKSKKVIPSTVADIDIDSNNDNDHRKEGVGHVQNQHPEEEHEEKNNFSDSNKSQSFSRYTDADKITEITGIAKANFSKYCYGQPLDNARDDLETNYQINPMISTRLTRVREEDNDRYDLLHIVVRNSNPGNKVAFTPDRLKSILDYKSFHGSKLNVFRPSSGALGNATKDYLTMPYALINSIADDRTIHDKQCDYPLIIRHNKTEFKARITVDRRKEDIIPRFDTPIVDESVGDGYTEIELAMPIINRKDFQLSDYLQYSCRYAIFSTHIAYNLEFYDDVIKEKQIINLPACHMMPSGFINENSIYHYTFKAFKDLIYDLHDNSETIIDALKNNGFREAYWNFSKDHALRILTTGDLKSDENLMKEISDLLRRVMNFPIPKLSTPYDSAHYRCQRKVALIERLKQTLPSTVVIDSNENNIRYKGVDGYVTIENDKIYTDEERYKNQHNNKTAVKFPFIFEIMIVPVIEYTDTFFSNQIYDNGVIFIGGLNYSTTPTGTGSEYFEVHERDPYSPWMFNYKSKEGDSLLEHLEKCGFVPGWKTRGQDSGRIDESKQKQPCVVIAHLVTPKPRYVAGYGKSHIDLNAYASTIAQTTVELVNGIPSKALARKRLLGSNPIIHYLRIVIKKRWEYIKSRLGWKRGDLSILDVDPWTQSTVWYDLREEYLI
ncbi:MAG: hypothetical protein WA667_17915, partial [Candidatus Nitrosopolaris sp.]